jgi:DNA-binding NarL/FixJ family response regulator
VPETADPAGRRPAVLIVDDHELLAGTLALALRQLGHDVHTSAWTSPEAIVEAARDLAPAVVLLDLELGEGLGSGLDLIGPLNEAGGRVVMVTGITDRSRLGACIAAGATGVVSKATSFAALVETVQQAVAGDPVMSETERKELLDAYRQHDRAERERQAPFLSLTPREQVVLGHLVAGESAEAIADQLYLSLATVRSHIRAILVKLGVNSQLAAVALAHDAAWTPPRREPAS